ncbi:CBS domain-containing protein [Catenovulum sp. SM1970]|uniref:CBS domain-containing protein n=1 Tax=Marinifaba aquimaris TaxID=2741323 RepID=UPI0015739242|nr:CBS domain-containing protein [Marinifaba aquimaris]NTS78113.1 CBS domain-containing protein [Marinifaba aquimaris]
MSKRVVGDIMTTNVKFLDNSASLLDAHNITRDLGIRHIPVVDKETLEYLGVVSQKVMLSKIMNIVSTYGNNRLDRRESQVPIIDIMDSNNPTVGINTSLSLAANHFLDRKYGCLPVISDTNAVLGIVSSSDFVKLAIELLEE